MTYATPCERSVLDSGGGCCGCGAGRLGPRSQFRVVGAFNLANTTNPVSMSVMGGRSSSFLFGTPVTDGDAKVTSFLSQSAR
jgi:hypothetical protein